MDHRNKPYLFIRRKNMKTKILSFVLLGVISMLNACSPLTILTSSEGEQPAHVESYSPISSGYQPIIVDQVEVEVGVGSPIPVHVIVSGNLPDPCSQVEHTEIIQDGSNFIITLFATPDVGGPAVDGCIKDAIPFRMTIPLNVVDLPAGPYSVTVNDSRADFKLDTANSTSTLRTAEMPYLKSDIQIDDVNIDIGVGSPIPVHAIVSGNLPNACAQLGEVRVHQDGSTLFIQLLAYLPAQTDCNPDTLPFRLEVPLNILNMPEGPYEVNVNGATASFDLDTMPGISSEKPAELNLIHIETVEIQVGVGSPIPVDVIASGTWPDLCAQIASVESKINGFNIDITILASTVENCRPDNLGLPFRFAIPLNTVEMEEGTYTITINQITTSLDIPVQ
jgi:hypothetical protein